ERAGQPAGHRPHGLGPRARAAAARARRRRVPDEALQPPRAGPRDRGGPGVTSVAPGGDELEVARRQTLLYAADLAKVHRRLREDERRLARLTERLEDLSRVCLDVAAASSLEEAGERAARTFARWLGARDVVLLALRRGRFRVA